MIDEEELQAKLETLPAEPGCYLFIGKDAQTLYVGKAKSLRARVRSYFQAGGSDARYFIPVLRSLIVDLRTVVTHTEKEAAVLENELIKQHQPRFNVKLRDDKDFLCLRLEMPKRSAGARSASGGRTPADKWPRLETVRRPSPDGARYFGPYHSATSARRTLHLVNKHFHLRTCSDADFASRRRPCLQYQIKRCDAPCVYEVDEQAYTAQVKAVALFLEARHDELSRSLEEWMRAASDQMEFERAAIYRDQLRAVESIRETQSVVALSDVDQDVIGLYREGSNVEIELLFVRAGRVSDDVAYSLSRVELPDEEVLANFLSDFYTGDEERGPIPEEILLPALPDGADGISELLGERRGRRVALLVPKRGQRKKLLDMAEENAKQSFRAKRRAKEDVEARLVELRDKLRLSTLPRRIECCDISHLGGSDTVGAVVALLDGEPDKKRYRAFHVKSVGNDDYGAMLEVLSRRFRRGRDAKEASERDPEAGDSAWELPDLFVVDGGRGQLNVALAAARDLGLHELAIVGLAKERETITGDKLVDRVYLPGQKNGIPLRGESSSLFFLARARDEAHRFANVHREKLGKKRRLSSELDGLRGVGPELKKRLLLALGTIDAVKSADRERLLAIPGISARHADAVARWAAASTSEDGVRATSSSSSASE